MAEILDIVNEHDEVIGQVERDDSVDHGYIFRKVFVGFYTPEKELILQKRSMAKKSNPGKLTSTVSGHVESGHTYDETAVKESYEETGTVIDANKLEKLGVVYSGDDSMRAVYAYLYDGDINALKIEPGEGDGFVAMPVDELREAFASTPEKFSPFLLGEAGKLLIDHIAQR